MPNIPKSSLTCSWLASKSSNKAVYCSPRV
ncbi:unnamed protein product [Ectocarpus sp. CCAP 1310/34]|nr:unnamed protein product [Ectocarpus sp. CCAP 1310/34]